MNFCYFSVVDKLLESQEFQSWFVGLLKFLDQIRRFWYSTANIFINGDQLFFRVEYCLSGAAPSPTPFGASPFGRETQTSPSTRARDWTPTPYWGHHIQCICTSLQQTWLKHADESSTLWHRIGKPLRKSSFKSGVWKSSCTVFPRCSLGKPTIWPAHCSADINIFVS